MTRRECVRRGCAIGVLLWTALAVQADWIGAKSGGAADPESPTWQPLHLADYGQEKNISGRYIRDGNDLVDLHGGICAAVATMNSFVYLENRYPQVYQNQPLTGGDPQSATTALASGWGTRAGMYGMDPNDPTSAKDRRIWENKVYWLEDKAPGKTTLAGQYYRSTVGWHRGDALQGDTYPTWEFLWSELARCEDVEIAFDSHCVTLVDLFFNDQDGDGERDPGEATKLGYLDPNPQAGNTHPNNQFQITDLLFEGGRLRFEWWQDSKNWDIEFAFAESPIPEPATLLLVVCSWMFRRR